MDPEATLADLVAAVGDRDWDRVDDLAEGLLKWMERSGFPPTTVGPKSLGKQWHRTVATFLCYAAKSKARNARKKVGRKHDA